MTARVILPAGASREEWLQERRNGIGGSDIGALLNCSPWATPADVYAAKVEGDTADETPAMAVGNALEAGVLALGLAWLQDTHGGSWWADDVPALLAHPDHDVVRYSPDGIAHGPSGSVLQEAKVTSRLPDEPHQHWVAQVQWGLAVTGLPAGLLSAVTGSRAEHWWIDSDPVWQAEAIAYALDWWDAHVETGTPPDPTTLAEYARWWRPEPGLVLSPRDSDAAVLAITRADYVAAKREADARKKAYEAELVRVLRGTNRASAVDVNGTIVKLSRVAPDRIDTAALREAHPRIAAKFTRPGAASLRASWPKTD